MACLIPDWKKPFVTACRFNVFWVCLSLTRFRMKPGFVDSGICRPRRGWENVSLPCWRTARYQRDDRPGGALIDATLIKAQPRPPRRGEPSPDPEADWIRRGKDGHFGYKVHLSVDQGRRLLRRLALTAANVSETHLFEEMVVGDEAAGLPMEPMRKTPQDGVAGTGNFLWHHQPALAISPISAQQKKRNKFLPEFAGP